METKIIFRLLLFSMIFVSNIYCENAIQTNITKSNEMVYENIHLKDWKSCNENFLKGNELFLSFLNDIDSSTSYESKEALDAYILINNRFKFIASILKDIPPNEFDFKKSKLISFLEKILNKNEKHYKMKYAYLKTIIDCMDLLQGICRYVKTNKTAPEKLSQLYPDFIDNKAISSSAEYKGGQLALGGMMQFRMNFNSKFLKYNMPNSIIMLGKVGLEFIEIDAQTLQKVLVENNNILRLVVNKSEINFAKVKIPQTVKSLEIRHSKVSNLSIKENIEYLDLSYDKIDNIQIPKSMPNLKTLILSNSNISEKDLTMFLSKTKNLVELNISDTNIDNLNGIDKLKNLKALNIFNTKISDIEPLLKLEHLKRLNAITSKISKNDIRLLENKGIEVF